MKLILSIYLSIAIFSCGEKRKEPEGTFSGECTDGADNDSDGTYDCNDEDCAFF